MFQIMVVEDDTNTRRLMETVLKQHGYQPILACDGVEALEKMESRHVDLIVLDLMMPRLDGLEACTKIREFSQVPIIMLTAKSEDMDKLLGFEHGADDYLTKPFAMGELLARVRALTRRREAYTPELLSFEGMTLNLSTFELQGPGGSFRLGNKEFQMMEMLMSHPGSVISADQFMERIWGYDSEAEINIVWTYLSYLRKKITALEALVQIRAIRGAGYRLEATKKNA